MSDNKSIELFDSRTIDLPDEEKLLIDPQKQLFDESIENLDKKGILIFPNPNDLDEFGIRKETKLFAYTSETKKLKIGDFVGVIQGNNSQLFIHSRFDSSSDKNFFLYHMLEKVFNISFTSLTTRAENTDLLFELLVALFPFIFKSATKKGLFKQYREFAHNDSNLRGTIDVKRQLTENVPFMGHVAYHTREYSRDNWVIYLICAVIHEIEHSEYSSVLKSNPRLRTNIKLVKAAGFKYDIYSLNRIIHENEKNPVRHSYYHEYRQLQKLCLAILKHQAMKYTGSGSQELNGFIVSASWLYEEYLATILHAENFDVIHPKNKAFSLQQQIFAKGTEYSEKDSNGRKINVEGIFDYPDFLFKSGNRFLTVADAKYKDNPGKKVNQKNDVHNQKNDVHSDILQVMGYMYQFQLHSGFLIYPSKDKRKNWYEKLEFKDHSNDVFVRYRLGVGYKKNDDWGVYKRRMEENESLLNECITGISSWYSQYAN